MRLVTPGLAQTSMQHGEQGPRGSSCALHCSGSHYMTLSCDLLGAGPFPQAEEQAKRAEADKLAALTALQVGPPGAWLDVR